MDRKHFDKAFRAARGGALFLNLQKRVRNFALFYVTTAKFSANICRDLANVVDPQRWAKGLAGHAQRSPSLALTLGLTRASARLHLRLRNG